MSDVLELLARDNPVAEERLALPPGLAPDAVVARAERAEQAPAAVRRVPRRPLIAATAALAVTAAVLVTALATHRDPDLAARAYAAVDQPGIAHWVVTIEAYDNGTRSTTQREEGWALPDAAHTILQTDGAAQPTERRYQGTDEEVRVGDAAPAPVHGQTDLERTLPGTDPLAAFRTAYEDDRLTDLGDSRFRVTTPGAATLVYAVDPSTGDPVTLTETDGALSVIQRFATYERLPDTPANRALLDWR